jgi:hypothetical protein
VADYRAARPQVDAGLVTPADGHREVSAVLRAGKDCFVEKPLTLTSGEGRQLAAVVRATGRMLQVGHIFRFHPVTEALRERLASGSVGGVRYCTGRFAGFKRPRTDVGVTQTDGIHYFDLFAYLLGRRPTAVTATLRDYLGRGLDDCSFSTVEYGDILALSRRLLRPWDYRDCVIVGERPPWPRISDLRGSSTPTSDVNAPGGLRAEAGSSVQGHRRRAPSPRARAIPGRLGASRAVGGGRGGGAAGPAGGGSGAAVLPPGPPGHPRRGSVAGAGDSPGARRKGMT